jgi:hypothetical protein
MNVVLYMTEGETRWATHPKLERRRVYQNTFLILITIGLTPGWAGQYITEDPDPTPYGHVEMIPFSNVTKIKPQTISQTPALEANFGILPDLQGHVIFPAVISKSRGEKTVYGYGDIETGIKYRFFEETDILPAMAFYPKCLAPIGDWRLGLGLGGTVEEFPLWFEKNIDSWKITGGGGYALTQAPDTSNYGFGGVVIQRDITETITLGSEFYGQGDIGQGVRASLIWTLGGNYKLTEDLTLAVSAGHSIAGQKTLMGYVGLDFTLGGDTECPK